MRKFFLQEKIAQWLKGAHATLNGHEPWDPQIRDERVYGRVLARGLLGLGESYMDGWWDCDALDELSARIIRSGQFAHLCAETEGMSGKISAKLLNRQSRRRAFHIGKAHYDIGNDVFESMLDRRLTYTCGYWKNAKTLDEAQEAKLDLVCRKIGLKSGDRVLDIGCGWGSFASFAAKRYGAEVVGITVSEEQRRWAAETYAGLPVSFMLLDYRDVSGRFDHIVSLGMFEHVGVKNYRTYFDVARRCLKDGGLFLLHTIVWSKSGSGFNPWLGKYIFPNAQLPSFAQIATASEGILTLEDMHNVGPDYDRTLMAWYERFAAAWPKLRSRYDERFYRMWRYYLLTCAGSFRARENHLCQFVFSKEGVPGGYRRVD